MRVVTATPGGSGHRTGRHYDRSARCPLHWPARMRVQEARPGTEKCRRWNAERRRARNARARAPCGRRKPPRGADWSVRFLAFRLPRTFGRGSSGRRRFFAELARESSAGTKEPACMNTTRKQKRGPLLSPPPQAGEEIARHAKHKARRARRNDETARARPLSRPPAPAGEEAVSRAGLLRGLNSAWLFWTVCAEKSCRRARAIQTPALPEAGRMCRKSSRFGCAPSSSRASAAPRCSRRGARRKPKPHGSARARGEITRRSPPRPGSRSACPAARSSRP